MILQPDWTGLDGPLDPDPPEFSLEEILALARESGDEAARARDREAKEVVKANIRRNREAMEEVRREEEEAVLAGRLSPDAEAFRDVRLKPKIREAHDFTPVVREPIVQGLFFRDSLTWVAGRSGTFKSFVTADLAFRYGQEDMDYHGMRMTTGRSLLVVAEGAASYADRKTAWEKEHGREVKNVSIYPAPLQLGDTLKEMPALISYLREEAEAGRPFGLILFDTQAMCTVGVDENTSEMNRVINILHQIREASGACVMVVHHFGKDKRAGLRGSSMIYAAADTVCILKRQEDAMDVVLSTAQGDEGKQKDAETKADFLTLELKAHPVGEDYFGDTVYSLVPLPGEGGSTDTHTAAPQAPASLPAVTDIEGYYLAGIGTYEEDGAAPASLRERLEQPEYMERIPRPPHNATRTTAGNRLQDLKKKGLTEQVPGAKGKWRVTPLGNAVIAQRMIDRLRVEADWADRSARKGRFRGGSTSGSEPGSPTLVNQSSEPGEPESEPGSDLREPK